jgi:hypothetical protein
LPDATLSTPLSQGVGRKGDARLPGAALSKEYDVPDINLTLPADALVAIVQRGLTEAFHWKGYGEKPPIVDVIHTAIQRVVPEVEAIVHAEIRAALADSAWRDALRETLRECVAETVGGKVRSTIRAMPAATKDEIRGLFTGGAS